MIIYQPAAGCEDCLEQQPDDQGVDVDDLCHRHLADLIAEGDDNT